MRAISKLSPPIVVLGRPARSDWRLRVLRAGAAAAAADANAKCLALDESARSAARRPTTTISPARRPPEDCRPRPVAAARPEARAQFPAPPSARPLEANLTPEGRPAGFSGHTWPARSRASRGGSHTIAAGRPALARPRRRFTANWRGARVAASAARLCEKSLAPGRLPSGFCLFCAYEAGPLVHLPIGRPSRRAGGKSGPPSVG